MQSTISDLFYCLKRRERRPLIKESVLSVLGHNPLDVRFVAGMVTTFASK